MPSRFQLHLVAAAAVAAIGAAPAARASEGEGPAIFLVPMTELVVPIVEGARADGRLRIRLVLRAHDAEALARVNAAMPALREASFLVSSEFARLYVSPMVPVDAGRLAAALQAALRAREPAVEAVLLVEVSAVRV